jgi:hypothetical protein
MHSKTRIALTLAAGAATALLLASGALAGHVKTIDSSVTLSQNNPFHGHVVSEKHACSVHRIVKVFNKKPGKDGLFGSTKSNNTGSWSIPAMPNGKFYAKMPRRSEGTAGTTFVCTGDKSPVRSFGP